MKLAGEKPTAKKDDPNRKVLTHPYSFEDGTLNLCSSVIPHWKNWEFARVIYTLKLV